MKTEKAGSPVVLGDVVCLKSGSPKMTVESIDDAEQARVTVVWVQSETGRVQRETFPLEALKRAWP